MSEEEGTPLAESFTSQEKEEPEPAASRAIQLGPSYQRPAATLRAREGLQAAKSIRGVLLSSWGEENKLSNQGTVPARTSRWCKNQYSTAF